MELWNWLNGKKTTIGAILFFVAWLLQTIVTHYFTTGAPEWLTSTIGFLNDLGAFVTGFGIAHKAKKSLDAGVDE